MQIKKNIFLFILLVSALSVVSQSKSVDSTYIITDIFSQINNPNEGANIELYQNPSLHVLINKSSRINKKEGLDGYRIQIFSGSGQNARDKSYEVQAKFVEKLPEFDQNLIYNIYQAPFFKLRLGDFRNKNEAVEFFHLVKAYFPNSYIVKSKIKYPKLEAKQE